MKNENDFFDINSELSIEFSKYILEHPEGELKTDKYGKSFSSCGSYEKQ